MADLVNTNRLRVTWTDQRQYWRTPAWICGHYLSRDHGKPRPEHNFMLYVLGRGVHVKWRPDGKRP